MAKELTVDALVKIIEGKGIQAAEEAVQVQAKSITDKMDKLEAEIAAKTKELGELAKVLVPFEKLMAKAMAKVAKKYGQAEEAKPKGKGKTPRVRLSAGQKTAVQNAVTNYLKGKKDGIRMAAIIDAVTTACPFDLPGSVAAIIKATPGLKSAGQKAATTYSL